MDATIQFFVFWALAFLTLGVALVLLSVFSSAIGNDLVLRSLGQEAAIAGLAALVEGTGAWLIVSFVPTAAKALFVPFLIVALIYKISHLEDWSRYDVGLLLMFQIAIGCAGACLFFGHVQAAIIILAIFGAILAAIAGVVRSL